MSSSSSSTVGGMNVPGIGICDIIWAMTSLFACPTKAHNDMRVVPDRKHGHGNDSTDMKAREGVDEPVSL